MADDPAQKNPQIAWDKTQPNGPTLRTPEEMINALRQIRVRRWDFDAHRDSPRAGNR